MATPTDKKGECKLCKRDRTLQRSHVIPRFVRSGVNGSGVVKAPRYYKGTGGGFQTIEQDLPKKTWLCYECEQLLSRSEKSFAEAVYQGLWTGKTGGAKVQVKDVHRFLVSMAWRTWHWFAEHGEGPFKNVLNRNRLSQAEQVWRMYLLGERSDVGEFKQHMVLDERYMPHPTAYYWSRGISLDVVGDGRSKETILMVYTKIPKIAMFGTVEQEKGGYWSGTLVDPRLGDIWTGQQVIIPDGIVQYIKNQGEKVLRTLDDVPGTVKKKTMQMMRFLIEQEGDDYLKRDAVRSLVADDRMEFPVESIISDALRRAANHPDARARRMGSLIDRLNEAEMKSLHRETNRIGIRCKALNVEERFSFLADGSETTRQPGEAILIGVEVFRTRECAMERSLFPMIFGLDTEEVTIALGAEMVEMAEGFTERGIRYLP